MFNFEKTAAGHMTNPARKVPIQILDDVIKITKGLPDQGGSKGLMYYSEMFKNGSRYNFEVLYDKTPLPQVLRRGLGTYNFRCLKSYEVDWGLTILEVSKLL